jgi:hypothetical protein
MSWSQPKMQAVPALVRQSPNEERLMEFLFGSAGCRYIIGADIAGRIAMLRTNLDPIAN